MGLRASSWRWCEPRPRDQKGKILHTKNLKMAEREGEDLNLTDYENFLLARFDSRDGVPQGLERLRNERWVAHVQADLPKSDFTWEQYEFHVNSSFGDEWFFDQDRPPEPESEEERPRGKRCRVKDA